MAKDWGLIMADSVFPVTLWYSTLGTGDGHDFATRGYLKALMKVGYQGLRLPPSLQTSVLRIYDKSDNDLSGFADLVRPASSVRMKPLVLVQPGDPRIGTKRLIEGTDAHGSPTKVEIEITEGSVDLDVPQEYTSQVKSEVKCVVIHHDPVSICRQYTSMVKRGRPPGVAYVGVTVWETSEIPQAIAVVLSELDRIVVPSVHTKIAFEKSGVSCPIDVVPHAFDAANWPEPTQEELGLYSQNVRKRRFVFYSIATPIERKNLVGLIRAYFRAFEDSEDVVLRIKSKLEPGRFDEMMKDAEEKSGIKGRRPLVKLFSEKWPIAKIRAFHLDGHCYVSATRGEGFGLPEMEARLCGRPVITTGWGSAPEVVSDDSNFVSLVDYDLVPVFNMHGVGCYEPEQRWAEPKDESLVEAMRGAYGRGMVHDAESWRLMNARFGEDVVGRMLSKSMEAARLDEANEGLLGIGDDHTT